MQEVFFQGNGSFSLGFKNGACQQGEQVLFFLFLIDRTALVVVFFFVDIENQRFTIVQDRKRHRYNLDGCKNEQKEKGDLFHGRDKNNKEGPKRLDQWPFL